MPLVTSYDVLKPALAGGYAVGAFNANNLESVQATIEACEEHESPVILQVSQGAIGYAGLEEASAIVKIVAEKSKIPVVLHLDHGTSYEQNVQCLRAGFTSLMYDGSKEPYEVNVATSADIARMVHAVGLQVECELGIIPKIEDFCTHDDLLPLINGQVPDVYACLTQEQLAKLRACFTEPDQAKDFWEKTNCDSLAVSIGAIHGMPVKGARLEFDRLQAIMDRVPIPLVLHGSTGIEYDDISRACEMGVCKVNVATALSKAFIDGISEALKQHPNEKDFRKILGPAKEWIKREIEKYLPIFGCEGKAYTAGWTPGPQAPKITKESPE
ncbi:MAG: class II fructose-bisphosphate aldolase [Armatimonadetes bacterium]|nr:class II fructose-bisphosphate aldolase [Armatimonadota bacterium]